MSKLVPLLVSIGVASLMGGLVSSLPLAVILGIVGSILGWHWGKRLWLWIDS